MKSLKKIKLLNQDASVRDYQEVLEKTILKLNYKSFTQIVILGSSSFIPFMRLKASDRRAIIEDLLDIEIFSLMNHLLKSRVAQNKDDMGTVDIALGLSKGEKEHLEFLLSSISVKTLPVLKKFFQRIISNCITYPHLRKDGRPH